MSKKYASVPPGDGYKIRCPRLGHQIHFSYCRSENKGLPCLKVLDCWSPHFNVNVFLKRELTPEEWQTAFETPPPPKMLSLVDLIKKARSHT